MWLFAFLGGRQTKGQRAKRWRITILMHTLHLVVTSYIKKQDNIQEIITWGTYPPSQYFGYYEHHQFRWRIEQHA
jgi:hypothetical protein